MPTLLTKSRYLTALTCEKRMWHEAHDPNKEPAGSIRRAADGIRVGELARQHYPDGVLVATLNMDLAVKETAALMASDADVIFEAAFLTEGAGVRVDILERSPRTGCWNIIEVKASTSPVDHHHDVALQNVILERSGVKVDRVKVLHLNPAHRFPDVQPLLLIQDVTELIVEEIDVARSKVTSVIKVLNQPDPPRRQIGRHCDSGCCSYAACFKHVPLPSIFNIPRIGKKADDLISQGILAVSQVPAEYRLTSLQRLHANAMTSGSPYIDLAEIRRQLSALSYPLRFFDLEAFDYAIPQFENTKPYEQIPFQFSCHALTSSGELTHHEFLHLDGSDPRPPFIRALLDSLGEMGSVIVYNASYERSKLAALAQAFPAHSFRLNAIISRLWDQAVIFKDHYIHPAFGGSFSIKAVLPVLVPELSYDKLDQVHNGTEAQDVWWAMIVGAKLSDRESTIKALREYCALDTLAMVKLHEVIHQLVMNTSE